MNEKLMFKRLYHLDLYSADEINRYIDVMKQKGLIIDEKSAQTNQGVVL